MSYRRGEYAYGDNNGVVQPLQQGKYIVLFPNLKKMIWFGFKKNKLNFWKKKQNPVFFSKSKYVSDSKKVRNFWRSSNINSNM